MNEATLGPTRWHDRSDSEEGLVAEAAFQSLVASRLSTPSDGGAEDGSCAKAFGYHFFVAKVANQCTKRICGKETYDLDRDPMC